MVYSNLYPHRMGNPYRNIPNWGLPRVKHGTGGCNPTILSAKGGIGYIVKQAKRAQRRKSLGRAVMRTCKLDSAII